MKVSFSLSSSSKPSKSTSDSSSDQNDESANKEFITEFDPSKTLINSHSKSSIVIPPIPNEWSPQKQLMTPDEPNIVSNGEKGCGSDPASSIERSMLMKLKNDLKRLPDDRGTGEFDEVPVEDFASAYLRGYGWCEGRGIGKNAKEDVKVVQYTHRAAGEGLGFVRTANG